MRCAPLPRLNATILIGRVDPSRVQIASRPADLHPAMTSSVSNTRSGSASSLSQRSSAVRLLAQPVRCKAISEVPSDDHHNSKIPSHSLLEQTLRLPSGSAITSRVGLNICSGSFGSIHANRSCVPVRHIVAVAEVLPGRSGARMARSSAVATRV